MLYLGKFFYLQTNFFLMDLNFAMCTVCHELKCHIRAQCEGGEGFRNLRKHTYVILEHSLKYVNNNHWQKCFVFGSECVWQRGGSHCMLAGRLFIPFFSTLYDLVMHCDMVQGGGGNYIERRRGKSVDFITIAFSLSSFGSKRA